VVEELADTAIYLIGPAEMTGTDLHDAIGTQASQERRADLPAAAQ
jgi:hypothetical protein